MMAYSQRLIMMLEKTTACNCDNVDEGTGGHDGGVQHRLSQTIDGMMVHSTTKAWRVYMECTWSVHGYNQMHGI